MLGLFICFLYSFECYGNSERKIRTVLQIEIYPKALIGYLFCGTRKTTKKFRETGVFWAEDRKPVL
jgi:hypothetical protein